MNNDDTICAIATGAGGAIGIIRISGRRAVGIAETVFTCAGKPLHERRANSITFGKITSTAGEVIDEVLLSLFRAPHSYTGEDSVEISCHGSQYILQQVMQLLIENGCRQAGRGEFTQRAFLNDKMDLCQAEAVADLIASSSSSAHKMAMCQLRGDFSRQLSLLREKLLKLTSFMELELDFSDHEELEFADRGELKTLSRDIEKVISRLVQSFSLGNALKNGVPVAIVGDTNAGKSTFLNAFVGAERAIVSEIHGTTRDVIEDTVNIDGVVFRFIDTAGIRDTTDEIETLGIERTFMKIEEAQIVLWVIDVTRFEMEIRTLATKIVPLCENKKLIILLNKTDLIENTPSGNSIRCYIPQIIADTKAWGIRLISAKNKENLEELKQDLVSMVANRNSSSNEDVIVSNLRHYEALSRALAAINRVQDGLATQLPTDLVTQDLRDCLTALADITGGEITSQETLSNIFSHFCVGK